MNINFFVFSLLYIINESNTLNLAEGNLKTLRFNFHVQTIGITDLISISKQINKGLNNLNVVSGIINVFSPGATTGITTMEYEPGAVEDFKDFLNKYVPYNLDYKHHQTWGCDNGASHLRASIIGPSITIPVENSEIIVGRWQSVVLIDFDTKPRKRKIVCTFTGE